MMRLGIFLQIGFLAGAALFLALTVYYYPIPSMACAALAVLIAASALGSGGSDLTTGAGCLGFIILILGALYGAAYLLFCFGGRCA